MLNDLQMPSAFKALHRKQMHASSTAPQNTTTAVDGSQTDLNDDLTGQTLNYSKTQLPGSETPYETDFMVYSRSTSSLTMATDVSTHTPTQQPCSNGANASTLNSMPNEPFTLVKTHSPHSNDSQSQFINADETAARLDQLKIGNSCPENTTSQTLIKTLKATITGSNPSNSGSNTSKSMLMNSQSSNKGLSSPSASSSPLDTPPTNPSYQSQLNVTFKPLQTPKSLQTSSTPSSPSSPTSPDSPNFSETQPDSQTGSLPDSQPNSQPSLQLTESQSFASSPSLSTRSCPPRTAVLERDSSLVKLKISSVASFSSGVDQYGFKKPVNDMSVEAFDAWSRSYASYMDVRQTKWENLLKSYGLTGFSKREPPERFPPDSHRIRKYVRKGIPPAWRGAAWFYYAKGPEKLNSHPHLYAKLVQESANLVNNDTEHIERDLHRTFPDNVHFRNNPHTNEESRLLKSLRRVLTAFSVYCPRVGYCQSLNFVAGNLLLFMPEEKAFWMLVIITQQHLPGLHDVNLEQVNIAQGVLMLSVRDRMPKVWQTLNRDNQLEENFISSLPPISLCTAPWFMSLMVNVLPTETLLRVWDCFFLEGTKTLYRISLAVFKLMEPQLLKASDELEVFQIIQSFPNHLYDPELLLKTCYKRQNGFGHLSNEDISLLRSFVVDRRRRSAQAASKSTKDETSDRREYARLHRGRRIRARLKLYR